MARALFIIDPQVGFNHHSVADIFPKIIETAKNFEGEVLVTSFFNSHESNFVKQLGWMRFFDDEDTKLIEGFESLKASFFKHYTYGCLTPEVIDFLHEKDVDKIYFAGVFTDVCIAMSAMDAFDKGYKTSVVTDLVATLHGDEIHQAALKSLDIMLGSNAMVSSNSL